MSGETFQATAHTQILLAPPGAGKTEFALQQLREVLETDGWPQVWVLLPNGLQEQRLRQRLFARAGASGTCTSISAFFASTSLRSGFCRRRAAARAW